jgi:copper chaperone CopZ
MMEAHQCSHRPVEPLPPPPKETAHRATREARLVIRGMGCGDCVARIYNALVSLSGVGTANVSLDPPLALVRYDPHRVSPARLVLAVWEAGAASHQPYQAATA